MAYHHSRSPVLFTPDSLANTDEDFLKDPALWRDRLPQPYRMIDEMVKELLMMVFDNIELRKIEKERQAKERKVPDVGDATLMMSLPESEMAAVASADGAEYIVTCGSLGLHVARLTSGESSDSGSSSTAVSKSCGGGRTTGLVVQSRGGAVFIGLVMNQAVVRILVYKDNKILDICQIEEFDSDKRVNGVKVSSNLSHLAVILTPSSLTSDAGADATPTPTPSVSLYSLPIDQWIQQLQLLDSAPSNDKPQLSFTSPSLTFSIVPPTRSSPTSDPIQIMKLVQEKSVITLPVDNIAVTDAYLQARKQLFLSQPHRRDFVQNLDSHNKEEEMQGTPLFEFLYYWDGSHTQTASAVAIVWKKSFSLLVYLLNKKPNNVAPDRVYLHARHVSSLAVSDSGTNLCVGLESGNIAMYDIKKGVTWGVKSLSPGFAVSAIKFAPSLLPRQPVVLLGGCGDGSVHCIQWQSITESTHTVLNSGYKCSSGVRDIIFSSSIPAILTTRHEDGLLLVWEWQHDRIPLCSLSLPSPFKHISHSSDCPSAVASSDSVFAIGTQKSGSNSDETQLQYGTFCWGLTTCEVLRKTCINSSSSTTKASCSTTATSGDDQQPSQTMLMDVVNHKRKCGEEINEGLRKCWGKLETTKPK